MTTPHTNPPVPRCDRPINYDAARCARYKGHLGVCMDPAPPSDFRPGAFWATDEVTRGNLTAKAEYDPHNPPKWGEIAIEFAIDHALTTAAADVADGVEDEEFEFFYDDGGHQVSQAHAFMVRVTREDDGCPECARSFGPDYKGKCYHY